MIFSIAMGADNSFYVKSIATYAPTFFGYIILVLASVARLVKCHCIKCKLHSIDVIAPPCTVNVNKEQSQKT